MMDMRFSKDENIQQQLREEIMNKILPQYCKTWDAKSAKNGGYIALERVSVYTS